MSVTALNERGKKVLQAVIESYIDNAVPVSSQNIAQRFRARLSPATIRNVLAELDELGLVWQPHTSAGRIPTDEGYRYYIDSLLQLERLTAQEKELIESRYPSRYEAFEELLQEVLQVLSNFSGYTALAFSSGVRRIIFKKMELVSVETTKLLVVLVSLDGLVKTAVLNLPRQVKQDELARIANFLNQEFIGLTLDEIKETIYRRLMHSPDAFYHILKQAEEMIDLTFEHCTRDRLFLEGASCIFRHPEFQNARKLQAMLEVFDNQDLLLEVMRASLDREGIAVHIGKENPSEEIHECSLVVSNFKITDRNMGTLGIIGPRRMSYARAISAVEYIARSLAAKIGADIGW